MKDILKHYTILYAEDNLDLQKITTEYLQRYFKEVYVASDGQEALNLYDTCQADVILLDIDMPYVDGLSVATHIRQSNDNIPIMMLTAFTDTALFLKAIELNLCKYLVKPIDRKIFREALLKVSIVLTNLNTEHILLFDGYKWDSKKEVLSHHSKQVALSQKEQLLLALFMKNYRCCVGFEEIMAVVWQDEFEKEISQQSVKLQVTMLRKKLPKDSIKNVYGKGYILK